MNLYGKKVLSVDDLSDGDLGRLFFCARNEGLRKDKKKRCHGIVLTAFFEPSTRTRLSFEMAAHLLGLNVLTFDAASSSMHKGESEIETIRNLASMDPDILVVRSRKSCEALGLSELSVITINGGDGSNEHPSQALIDCFTLLNHFRTDDLRGRHILIVGDLAHSRVAHSNLKLMKRLGASVWLLAPSELQYSWSDSSERQISSFSKIDRRIDAVVCLRIQQERFDQNVTVCSKEFTADFGLTMERLELLGKDCVVLHPGPMNLGVEIMPEVARHPQSLIYQQVRNGVMVRAALLELCLSGGRL